MSQPKPEGYKKEPQKKLFHVEQIHETTPEPINVVPLHEPERGTFRYDHTGVPRWTPDPKGPFIKGQRELPNFAKGDIGNYRPKHEAKILKEYWNTRQDPISAQEDYEDELNDQVPTSLVLWVASFVIGVLGAFCWVGYELFVKK